MLSAYMISGITTMRKRKRIKDLVTLFALFLMSFSVVSHSPQEIFTMKIKITIDQQEIVIKLVDNPASRQLLSQLPLTLDFTDYANTEKVAYLPQKLSTQDVPNAAQISGDFTYYAPWGNLAIFYKDTGHDSNLYTLGYIESGKEKLAEFKQNFTATITTM